MSVILRLAKSLIISLQDKVFNFVIIFRLTKITNNYLFK